MLKVIVILLTNFLPILCTVCEVTFNFKSESDRLILNFSTKTLLIQSSLIQKTIENRKKILGIKKVLDIIFTNNNDVENVFLNGINFQNLFVF